MAVNRRNLDWWCERGILALVLTTLIFAPLAFGATYTWTFLVVELLVIAVGLVWLVRLWGGHKPKLLWPPLAWAVIAFVVYAVARYFISDIEYQSRLELVEVLLYAFLFLAVMCNLYGQDEMEAVAYTLVVVATVASSYAMIQFFRHSTHVWNLVSPYPGRAAGTYINPDHFCGFLELVLPLPLAFLLVGRIGIITRVLLIYAIAAIMAGIAVTFSRGGWIAAGSSVLLLLSFLLFHRNHRLRALLVLVVMLGGGVLFTIHVLSDSVGYMQRISKPDKDGPAVLDTSSRLEMWRSAVHMWQAYPLLGVGPGLFDYRFRQYRSEAFQDRPEHAHNDYLELLADWGAVGTVIVLAGLVVFIFTLVETWPHVRRDENDFGSAMSSRYAFFLGGCCGLFAIAVHSAVDFNLHVPANALVGITLLGLVASNVRFATKRYWIRARLPLQWGMTILLGGSMIFFGSQIWRRGGQLLWTQRAEHMPNFSDKQAAALQKAMSYEPNNYLTAYNIGECYRVQSLNGTFEDSDSTAQKALKYYALGMKLDPYDAYCPLRTGMCLDWLGRHGDSEKYYSLAESLDPNGNFVVGNIGWHYVNTGDYSAARQWFIRAYRLSNGENETAKNYAFGICQSKLIERASGKLPLQLFYNGKVN